MTLTIVGAGMAGLLAANLLRHRRPVVIEAQPSLPNNHSAVLRFRSSIVGDALGIQFKRVNVVKSVIPWRNPVADALAYSRKNLGRYRSDRSTVLPAATATSERWIAPPDLVERMARDVEIELGRSYDPETDREKVLSTIPMPVLAGLLGYPKQINFEHVPGVNVRARVAKCDAFASVMVPDPAIVFSRASITGDELIVECPNRHEDDLNRFGVTSQACELLGLREGDVSDVTVHPQRYAKIVPIDERERKDFIFWASSVTGRAFSLGRFACWRPGLLMDDLVQDVRLIDSWIGSSTPGYDMDIHKVKERAS